VRERVEIAVHGLPNDFARDPSDRYSLAVDDGVNESRRGERVLLPPDTTPECAWTKN
jgi:hypothetical protein